MVLNNVRFALLTFLAEKRKILGRKNASRLATANVIKIETESGRVWYSRVRYGIGEKFEAPTVIILLI